MDKSSIIWREIIDLWPSRSDFAGDLGISLGRVHKWCATGSVPARFLGEILERARDRGIPITAEDVVAAARNRRREAA